jgi:hypothetical protein
MWSTTMMSIMLAPQWCSPRINLPPVRAVMMYFTLL